MMYCFLAFMHHIAILDFGSQYTHLIARRIRELGVRSEIYPANTTSGSLPADAIGIILSGGPQSVYDERSVQIDPALFSCGRPVLGLCYGHQLMAQYTNGAVEPGTVREYGRAELMREDNVLMRSVPEKSTVWMSHGDAVTKLGDGFKKIGATADCPIAAMANDEKKLYGLQFHPEVKHSEYGMTMLNNFVFAVCGAEKNWNIEHLIDLLIADIRQKAADKKVFVLVSGGVDSSVTFALLSRALGSNRVYGLYVNTGFMRKDESEEIEAHFKSAGFENIHTFDAHEIFYERLSNVCDPEEKRKIIGATFIDVKDGVAERSGLNGDEWMLGQGTIYPDTIETGGTQHADTIKTHHNRVDAIQRMIKEGKVIEPIAEFYKDEVRELGRLLGLPERMISRHPFPGPGLAIRILCHDTEKSATAPVRKEKNAAVLPIRSVGVQGDNRTYAHPLVVWNNDGWSELDAFSSKTTNNSKDINRVVLLLNETNERTFSLPLKTKSLTLDRIRLLQDVDALVMREIVDAGYETMLWQCPVVLAPIGYDHFESIILRPVVSQEAMTAHFARLDRQFLARLAQTIVDTYPIDYILYDITNKPPGTIEWE